MKVIELVSMVRYSIVCNTDHLDMCDNVYCQIYSMIPQRWK